MGRDDTLHIQGAFTSSSFQLSSDGNGGTDISLCFCAGTHIGTPDGEVPVERLAVLQEIYPGAVGGSSSGRSAHVATR